MAGALIVWMQGENVRLAEARQPGRIFRDCGSCPLMVVVPAGTFIMGSPDSEEGRSEDEGPQRYVNIAAPFAVGVYEVTFEEWDACARRGGCGGYVPDDEGWGKGRRPVINVSWDDARAYVLWLSQETGERYGLLSEAEWEYAARAGTTGARYWGGRSSEQCGYANGYDGGSCDDGFANTAPVGRFAPNPWGLYDMLGNVWEWTEDCWHPGYRGAPSDGSAWRSDGDCLQRVVRGGSWVAQPGSFRSANRLGLQSGVRGFIHGFRVARAIR